MKGKKKFSIWSYVFRQKRVVIFTLLLLLFAVLLGRAVTYLQSVLVDRAIVPQNYGVFCGVAGAVLGLLLIEAICFYFQNKIFCNLGYDIATQIRSDLYQKIMYAPFSYFENNPAAGVLSRVSLYVNDLGDFVTKNLVPFMLNVLKFATVFIFMFAINVKLGALVLAVLIVVLLLVFFLNKVSLKLNKNYKKTEIDRDKKVMDSIYGLSAIVAGGGEDATLREFDCVQNEALRRWNKFSRVNELFLPLVEGLWFLGIVVVYIFSFHNIGLHGFEMGAVITFISYISQTNEPIKQSALNFQFFVNIQGTLNKIFDIMHIDISRRTQRTQKIQSQTPDISIKNITFVHKTKRANLKDFSADIPYGKKVAFVGETGSGKTILAYLLARIYSPQSGEVLIDGKDVNTIQKGDFEKHVAIISNHPNFFEQTLRDNLALGARGVSDQRIMEVLGEVGLKSKVEKLEQGLDQKLRNNADLFSESEKFMMSLARIILCDPSIIIFDGYFTAVNVRQRKKIFKIVQNFAKDKTCIFMCNPDDELPFDCEKINM